MAHYSPEEIRQLIDYSAREQNILPITSRCDARCVFCSHHNNPPEIQAVSIGTRTLDQIRETLGDLRGDREITIGESASNIIEGEPTLHPRFREVLELVRQRFPHTPVALTTNGRRLTEEMAEFLSRQQPLLVNLSLNSASVRGRQTLMGDRAEEAETAIQSVERLHRYGVPFQGSLVGMPNLTGWDDLRDTIRCLAEHGALSVRVFVPGFSDRVKEGIFPDAAGIHRELKEFLARLSDDLPCPVLLEPSYVQDLRAEVSGLTRPSPAWNAGVRKGDVFLRINGRTPASRVEAYALLEGAEKVKARIQRGERVFSAAWTNGPQGAGVTMEYDFDMDRARRIRHVVETAPGHVLALSSEFGQGVFLAAMDAVGLDRSRYTGVMVKNRTFGGTIRAAGLLTCRDYLEAWEAFCRDHPRPGAIILPMESFNSLGRDLTGRHVNEIRQNTGVPVALV